MSEGNNNNKPRTHKFTHQSVLLNEAIEALAIREDGIYVDATAGRGGHSQAILERLGPQGRLLTFDKDPDAISAMQQMFAHENRVEIIHGSFTLIEAKIKEKMLMEKISGVLFDLGVSSPQLDDASRGFSFLQDGPLDMRMDSTKGQTAAEWLAKAKEQEIADVLYNYGEERYSRRIARAIVQARSQNPIQTTGELSAIVSKAHPAWEKGKNPATRAFQGIRIFINNELNDVSQGLEQALNVLATGGRIAAISFHSLEDRIVKRFMQKNSKGEEVPKELPLLPSALKIKLKIIGKRIRPTETEVSNNPRARSATLRVAEKI